MSGYPKTLSTKLIQREILISLKSILAAMGGTASTSNNVEMDFKTEYINSSMSGPIVLENDKTGQYHIVADDMSIKQFKLIQMGERGSPTYTVTIKVYTVAGGGAVLPAASTNVYSGIAPQSILGMNSVEYYTNEPTKTDLVFHFPCDYSEDDVMGSGITIHGGSLVKQPRVGFRSYSSQSRSGVYTSPFSLSSYGTDWSFCWWARVINQDPISAFMKIFSNWNTIDDTVGNARRGGFFIELRNADDPPYLGAPGYNTKPYIDYRIGCVDANGNAVGITSSQASYNVGVSSPSTGTYWTQAAGKLFGVWTHFAFVRINADNYKFYADGVLVADILTDSTVDPPSNSGVQFGGCEYQWYHPQAVLCDDIRFYSSAVSAAEIEKMGAIAVGPPTTPTTISTAAGGLLLTDLDPAISVSKNQLIGVDVAETTVVDSGTEELLVTLVGLR